MATSGDFGTVTTNDDASADFQWQASTDGGGPGGDWANAAGVLSDVQAGTDQLATMILDSATLAENGYKVRCIATAPYDPVGDISDEATLTVDAAGNSPTAQAVIDRMANVSIPEQDAIAAFVDSQSSEISPDYPAGGSGNWELMDEFYCFVLNDITTDWLTGWKGLTIATDVGATHTANGASFTTGQYIDTGLHIGNTPQFYGDLTSSMMSTYQYAMTYAGTGIHYMCGMIAVRSNQLRHSGSGANLLAGGLNNFNNTVSSYGLAQGSLGGKLFTVVAEAGDVKLYQDGVSQALGATGTSATLPGAGENNFVGTRNAGSNSPAAVRDNVQTSFMMGTGNGFAHDNYHTNLLILHTALGVT